MDQTVQVKLLQHTNVTHEQSYLATFCSSLWTCHHNVLVQYVDILCEQPPHSTDIQWQYSWFYFSILNVPRYSVLLKNLNPNLDLQDLHNYHHATTHHLVHHPLQKQLHEQLPHKILESPNLYPNDLYRPHNPPSPHQSQKQQLRYQSLLFES